MADRRTQSKLKANGACKDVFKDPAWADQADELVAAVFAKGHLRTVAEKVSGKITAMVRSGMPLSRITAEAPADSLELQAAFKIGLGEAPRIFGDRLKVDTKPAESGLKQAVKDVAGDDQRVAAWANKMLADRDRWQRSRKSEA